MRMVITIKKNILEKSIIGWPKYEHEDSCWKKVNLWYFAVELAASWSQCGIIWNSSGISLRCTGGTLWNYISQQPLANNISETLESHWFSSLLCFYTRTSSGMKRIWGQSLNLSHNCCVRLFQFPEIPSPKMEIEKKTSVFISVSETRFLCLAWAATPPGTHLAMGIDHWAKKLPSTATAVHAHHA